MPGRTNDIDIRVRLLESRLAAAELKLLARDVDDVGDRSEKSGRKARKSAKDYDFLGRMIAAVRPATMIAAGGLAAQGLSAAAAGAVALGAALAPVSGALVAYPALALAAGQAMGVFKLGTAGVMDVVGGLNERLDRTSREFQALSPEAQKFAVHLAQMKNPLRNLQRVAQRNMLPGLDEGLRGAMRNLPVLRPIVAGTARVIGSLATQAGRLVGSRGFGADLATQGSRNVVWISRAGRAGLQLVGVVRHLLLAGGPLVSWITRLGLNFSRFANAEARAGRESGRLAAFFQRTRDVMSSLGSIALSLGRAFFNIARAGGPLGNDLLRSIRLNAAAFARWTASATGRNAIADFFRTARQPIYEIAKLARDIVKAFFRLGNQPGLGAMIAQIRTDMLPVLVRVVESTTRAFGPHLIDMITALARAFEPLAGASGPLIAYVDILTALANASAWIATTVPGGGAAITALFGAMTVWKAAQFADMITGFKSLRGALRSQRVQAIRTKVSMASLWLTEKARAAWAARTMLLVQTQMIAKLVAQRIATMAVSAATRAWMLAQAALNFVLSANPIGLIVIGIAALVAGFVLAYKKIGWFRNAVDAVWKFIKNNWPLLLSILTGPVGAAVIFIVRHWGQVKDAASSLVGWVRGRFDALVGFIGGLPGRIASAASGMWSGIKGGFKDAINWIIAGWNGLSLKIGGVKIDPPGPGSITIPDVSLDTPDIPYLAMGGIVSGPAGGQWVTGEAGPEINTLLPGGRVRVDPLTGPGARAAGAAAPLQRDVPPIRIELTSVVQLPSGRELAREIEEFWIDRKARR